MPEAVLSLKLNPNTGERTLVINYESDADALPFEHEDDHRAFVEKLLGHSLDEIADRLEINRSPPHSLIIQERRQAMTESNQEKQKVGEEP